MVPGGTSNTACSWFRICGASDPTRSDLCTNPGSPNPGSPNPVSMTSVVEVHVDTDGLSTDGNSPSTHKPKPKDYHSSFVQSSKRAANVYATSFRPVARRENGVKGNTTKKNNCSKPSEKVTEYSKPPPQRLHLSSTDLEQDPVLRQIHSESKAFKALSKRYKAKLVECEKVCEQYRNDFFRSKEEVKKLRAVISELAPDDLSVKATLTALDREKAALSTINSLNSSIKELHSHKEIVQRAREVDKKKHKLDFDNLKNDLEASRCRERDVKLQLFRERDEKRVLALELRNLEVKLAPKAPMEQLNKLCDRCGEKGDGSSSNVFPKVETVDVATEPKTLNPKPIEVFDEAPESPRVSVADVHTTEEVQEILTDGRTSEGSTKALIRVAGRASEETPQTVVLCLVCVEQPETVVEVLCTEPDANATADTPTDAVPIDAQQSDTFQIQEPSSTLTQCMKTVSPAKQKKKRSSTLRRPTVASKSRAGTLY